MPFLSKKQSAACFATGGFGGKVDCKHWANITDYKSLPTRKHKKKKIQEWSFINWLEQNHPELLERITQ